MNIAQALELAGKSLEAFEEKLHEIKLKELYELADNLRFVNNPPVFKTVYRILRERFIELYEYMKSSEKKRKHIDEFQYSERLTAYDMTGFEIFNYKS